MKNTSAFRFVAPRALKLRQIWRTMLLRYPGNGKAMPSVVIPTTSVPAPPAALPAFPGVPPPLEGTTVGVAANLAGFAAAEALGLGTGAFALGTTLLFAGAGGSAAGTDSGSPTVPAATGPCGAATSSTLYMVGGIGLGAGRNANAVAIIPIWNSAETPMGIAKERGVDRIALSPDGKRVAFTLAEGVGTALIVAGTCLVARSGTGSAAGKRAGGA